MNRRANDSESWDADCEAVTRDLVGEAVRILFQRIGEVEPKPWDYLYVNMNQGTVYLALCGRAWRFSSDSRLDVSIHSSELLDLMMDCVDEEFEASLQRESEVFEWICGAARDTRQVRWVDWEDEGDINEAVDFGEGYGH